MSLFHRVLPQPVLSLLILGLWMVLASAPSLAQFVLGAAVAVLLPWITRGFWPDRPRLSDPLAALKLAFVVLHDIVTANLLVARQVLGPPAVLRPAFLEVPLEIGDPFVATILGSIVSLTPGTVSVEIDRRRRVLLVHALHVEDAAEAIAAIKTRYEAPLRRIFAC